MVYMAHHHHHHHSDNSSLGAAFFLNLVFTIIEFVGGIYTNSLAILSDAIHDLGDSFSLGVAWYFQKVSKRPGDLEFTYGYRRFSVLGAIINSIVLVVGGLYIVLTAIPRLSDPQPTDANGMMILAALGIIFNGIAYSKTHHGHSHNEKVVSLHLLEDVLGWAAVLVGALIIKFTGWYIIDPILSIVIALFILWNVYKSLKETSKIILQGTPSNVSISLIKATIEKHPEVHDVHDIHIWTMDGEHNILTAHVLVDADFSTSQSRKLKLDIHHQMQHANIHHCTLELEYGIDDCNKKALTHH